MRGCIIYLRIINHSFAEEKCTMNNRNSDKITIDAVAVKFFVNPPANGFKYEIYQEAARRAYGDMSRHTLHFTNPRYCGETKEAIVLREELKRRLGCLLLGKERYILDHPKDYNDNHKDLCNSVSKIFTVACNEQESLCIAESFSMGQAQKFVNMVWKYVYLFYQYFYATEKSFDEELKLFNIIIPYLHTPVDSKVIEAATKKAYLKERINGPFPSWSKMTYEEYMEFQQKLRDNLPEGTCPFLWELKNWPFQ